MKVNSPSPQDEQVKPQYSKFCVGHMKHTGLKYNFTVENYHNWGIYKTVNAFSVGPKPPFLKSVFDSFGPVSLESWEEP